MDEGSFLGFGRQNGAAKSALNRHAPGGLRGNCFASSRGRWRNFTQGLDTIAMTTSTACWFSCQHLYPTSSCGNNKTERQSKS